MKARSTWLPGVARWLLPCAGVLVVSSLAVAANENAANENGANIPKSWLNREGECLKGHRDEHWACFARLMQQVPKDAPWRADFEYLGRGLWRLDMSNAAVDGMPAPKSPPGLPPAKGLDRIDECGDDPEYHRAHVACFDREAPFAIREEPALAGASWRRRLDEVRKTYARLDASEALTDSIFQPYDKPAVVFGMTLGQAFRVPACTIDAVGQVGRTPCSWRPTRLSLMGRQVLLTADMTPTWVRPVDPGSAPAGAFAAIDVEIVNGNLEAVHIPTLGLRFQDLIIAALKEKFGTPASAQTEIRQNAFGAKFQVATLGWAINGVSITFDGGDLDKGMVLLSTPRSQFLQKARAKLKQHF